MDRELLGLLFLAFVPGMVIVVVGTVPQYGNTAPFFCGVCGWNQCATGSPRYYATCKHPNPCPSTCSATLS